MVDPGKVTKQCRSIEGHDGDLTSMSVITTLLLFRDVNDTKAIAAWPVSITTAGRSSLAQ